MRRFVSALLIGVCLFSLHWAKAAVIIVSTTNNVSPAAGETSLVQALTSVRDDDTILFSIPGAGPHYVVTPTAGYPLIRAHNISIDGYTQPGATPNTGAILAANNAQIKVFLDSREGGRTVLRLIDGYGETEGAILPIMGATNVSVRGLGFLAKITAGNETDPAIYCVAFGEKARGGHISGCWFGVDADGRSVYGANAAVTGFRYRDFDNVTFLTDDTVIGVRPGSTSAEGQFNVFAGLKTSIILEGSNLRISGNFIGVLPSGTNEFNNAVAGLPNEGAIQIGLTLGGVVIGTDGNGENDASERNIISGGIPPTVNPNGFNFLIQLYRGQQTNVVIAGNYVGIGVDGRTRFTNGVSLVSLSNPQNPEPWIRIGSDLDGVSDALEGNVIYNNYPSNLFKGTAMVRDFIDSITERTIVSMRGNKLVNNFTPPVNPMADDGNFLLGYYGKAIVDLATGIVPTLSTNTSITRLIGSIPLADTNAYPLAAIDLYLADPEGIATGKAEGLPDPSRSGGAYPTNAPPGFVQGFTYLSTFFEGGFQDLDPAPGKFSFNTSTLNVPIGALLTITANYSQGRIGVHNAPTLTSLFSVPVRARESSPVNEPPGPLRIALDGTNVVITFTGVLQSAPSVTGTWTDVPGATSPHTTQADQTTRFYRARSL